jgi:hypothetical protein
MLSPPNVEYSSRYLLKVETRVACYSASMMMYVCGVVDLGPRLPLYKSTDERDDCKRDSGVGCP